MDCRLHVKNFLQAEAAGKDREQRCPFTLLWASRDSVVDHVGFHSSIACNQNTLRAKVPGSSV